MREKHRHAQERQRSYYARTASQYDGQHCRGIDEHQFALTWLRGVIELFGIKSLLDIGSGTGRALLTLKQAVPHLKVVGVEPSAELREQGYAKGLSRDELVDGDVHALKYDDGAFDIVSEFATLHHVPHPSIAVGEMLRVARTGIFISDTNSYGQGSGPARLLKQTLRATRLWPVLAASSAPADAATWRARVTGLFYSYSRLR